MTEEKSAVSYSGTGSARDAVNWRKIRFGWPADELAAFKYVVDKLRDRGFGYDDSISEGISLGFFYHGTEGELRVNSDADLSSLGGGEE